MENENCLPIRFCPILSPFKHVVLLDPAGLTVLTGILSRLCEILYLIFCTIASPNSSVPVSFAPSISRAKS